MNKLTMLAAITQARNPKPPAEDFDLDIIDEHDWWASFHMLCGAEAILDPMLAVGMSRLSQLKVKLMKWRSENATRCRDFVVQANEDGD